MGKISQLLEVEQTVTHEGQTYKLAPLTLEIQAQFEHWLENRAWAALERQRPTIHPQEYQTRVSTLQRDIASDEYGFFSECAHRALANPMSKGVRQLIYLRITANHPDVSSKVVWDIVEKENTELLRKIQEMDRDPNSPAPQPGGENKA